ncbi:MAG: ABC transporter permease [Gemmatimonadetes bacterium]|nr:ABC transporter permease [Gemmatimonadota bacterium]
MGLRRLLNALRPGRVEGEIRRELEFHLAEREDELVASGMSREAARREARRRFGHPGSLRERTRDADVATTVESVLADLRYAWRALAASRGYSVVAILSLALGIGANTAIFSLINAVMLRQLPVRDPQELVVVGMAGGDATEFTNPLWEQVRDGAHPFAQVLAYGDVQFNLAEAGEARPAQGLWVSGGFFEALGVTAMAGRTLRPEDDVRGCPATVVLSHAFWQSELGADRAAVGRTIRLGGHPHEIVGVVDPAFRGLEAGRAPSFYVPLCADAVHNPKGGFLDHRSYWSLRIIGRLAPGQTAASTTAQLATASASWFANTVPADWDAALQKDYLARTMDARPSIGELSSVRTTYAQALWALMAMVAVVLLIACANIANLMLVRAEVRQRELAVRIALGAGRRRVVRQLFTEGLVLAGLGATLGTLLAVQLSHAMVRWLSTPRNPVVLDLTVDARVLAFTVLVAVATALLFSLAPAWRAVRVDPQDAMRAHGRGTVGGRGRFGVGRSLVVAQVALSLVLVTGSALLIGSFRTLVSVPAGFDPDPVLIATADLKLRESPPAQRLALQRDLLERLRALPGVTHVAASFMTPLARMAWMDQVEVAGRTFAKPEDASVLVNLASPGWFATLGIPLLAGRDFASSDGPGQPEIAIVNEAAARLFFPDRSPVGARFRMARGDGVNAEIEVVGMVRNAKYRTLREGDRPQVFLALSQDTSFASSLSLVLRTVGPPAQLRDGVLAVVREVAPAASVQFRRFADQVAETLGTDRLLATLSAFFGGLALLLAMVGLYGTMAYAVARRRGEIGIRVALGARPGRLSRAVLGEVAWLLAVGCVVGLAGVGGTGRLIEGFLFDLGPRDPAILALSVAVLVLAGLLAGWLPARRAARMDPMRALREE